MSHQAELRPSAPAGKRERVATEGRSKTLLPVAGLLAALATSSCCLLPFLLFTLGISGAWIGNLTAMAPYQPLFFVLAVGLLGAGFYRVYRKPAPAALCVTGTACADPRADRVTKVALWGATVLVAAGVAFPWIAPLFIET